MRAATKRGDQDTRLGGVDPQARHRHVHHPERYRPAAAAATTRARTCPPRRRRRPANRSAWTRLTKSALLRRPPLPQAAGGRASRAKREFHKTRLHHRARRDESVDKRYFVRGQLAAPSSFEA